ncbi:MAG TPA: endopeptidase La [Aeromonadales bacterium]|nr:endopeptidase La [Aeromonadales bacterium]
MTKTKTAKTPETIDPKIELLPDKICILPLSERPFFPPQTLPVLMNEEIWQESLAVISESESHLAGLMLTNNQNHDETETSDFNKIGTLVRVHHPVIASGKIQFIAEGIQRFRIKKWLSDESPFLAEVQYPHEPKYRNQDDIRAYSLAIVSTLKQLAPLNPLFAEELKFFLNHFDLNDPSQLADFAASLTTSDKDELQSILETVHLTRRLRKVLKLVKKELQVAKIQAKIHQQVEEAISDNQRKFFLREQLKAIQTELGLAKDDRTADIDTFEKRMKNKKPSTAAKTKIKDETDKLKVLESGSPEYAVTRNYLDVITDLPWGQMTRDNLKLTSAKRVLNKTHAGLDDVKQRIIEFLAVGASKGEIRGSILLLVGPPGVGKTSIGKTIASALRRKFFRFSVGGTRDEAEIKGHRRTYIGAMPGRIIQALRQCGSSNPVIMLDEIDKIGASYQGDPASALLEVLDPEQNDEFLDHYLDVRFDLSKVMFICTANQLDTIPSPLLDRMEIIRLSGYLTEEKIKIAENYLWPRQLDKSGLVNSQLNISSAATRFLIDGYAREAGVRSLDKQLGRIVRKSVVELMSGKVKKIHITKEKVQKLLGIPHFQESKPNKSVGVVTGLAWTAMGGSTLDIEVALIHHQSRGLKLTGSLGDVMKESAQIAYSYILSHAEKLGIDKSFQDAFVHIHVPEGATPKDGPSAGITIASAILSAAINKRIKRPLAMSGELTLTGQVIAVGGIQEKIIAAKRVNIFEVILPLGVTDQFEKLPKHVKADLTVHFVETFDEVSRLTFALK